MPLAYSGRALARALAERIQATLPSGFVVVAKDNQLLVSSADELPLMFSVVDIDASNESANQALIEAASAILDNIQDYVVETTRTTWPDTGGRQANLTRAAARISDDELLLSYDKPEGPAVSLGSVGLYVLRSA